MIKVDAVLYLEKLELLVLLCSRLKLLNLFFNFAIAQEQLFSDVHCVLCIHLHQMKTTSETIEK